MWLVAPAPELVRGRRVVAHNNLLGDVKNMGAVFVDEDVVVDGDLVTDALAPCFTSSPGGSSTSGGRRRPHSVAAALTRCRGG